MGLRDLFRRNEADTNITNSAEIIRRYTHLRAVGRNLNHKLVERLSKDVLDDGGRKLGILQKDILVFNSEDESAVLMDYCLYDVRRNGRNTVEQYLLDSAPDPESDEMMCLRSMQHAVYSLFMVESVIPGFGVTVRDLLSNGSILIADMGFGSTAQPGLVFASRVLFHEGFAMTGGAALPIGVPPEDHRQAIIKKLAGAVTPDDDGYFDPAPIIRACLKQGCSSYIQYQEPTGRLVGRQRASERIGSSKAGRNAPCPCGSGKKFKNCCMRK
ncbi:MAG: YecA family protein [Thermoguttaceae bacterium]